MFFYTRARSKKDRGRQNKRVSFLVFFSRALAKNRSFLVFWNQPPLSVPRTLARPFTKKPLFDKANMSSLMSKETTTAATTDDQTSVEMKKRQQEDLEYARWFANLKKQVEGSPTKHSQEEEEEEDDERLVVDDRPPPVCCPICQKPLGQYYNAEEDKLRVWCRAGCWLPWTQDCEDTAKMLLFASVGLLDTFKINHSKPNAKGPPHCREHDLTCQLVWYRYKHAADRDKAVLDPSFKIKKNIASALFLDLWATTAQKRPMPKNPRPSCWSKTTCKP